MSEIEKSNWVMDFETNINCFIAVFEHYKRDIRYIFVVHEKLNHFEQLVTFLRGNIERKEWHISFNGLGFNGQITK